MSELITSNFKGSNISLVIKGLPIVITGKVIQGRDNIVLLKTKDNKTIHIAGNLIAFFF